MSAMTPSCSSGGGTCWGVCCSGGAMRVLGSTAGEAGEEGGFFGASVDWLGVVGGLAADVVGAFVGAG